MSYILDALKKTEVEQNPQLRAGLELHRQSERQHSWAQYLIAAALIGNLTVLVWLFGPDSGNSSTATEPGTDGAVLTAPTRSAASATTPGSQPSVTTDPAARPAPGQPEPQADSLTQRAPAAEPEQPPSAAISQPIHTDLAGMSDAARMRFPELSFSTHVYAADSSLRAVVVNGERLTEGDRLGSLRLTNITESGVVFRFENYLVSISVLDDWD